MAEERDALEELKAVWDRFDLEMPCSYRTADHVAIEDAIAAWEKERAEWDKAFKRSLTQVQEATHDYFALRAALERIEGEIIRDVQRAEESNSYIGDGTALRWADALRAAREGGK